MNRKYINFNHILLVEGINQQRNKWIENGYAFLLFD